MNPETPETLGPSELSKALQDSIVEAVPDTLIVPAPRQAELSDVPLSVGRYRVIERLGRGAQGEVFRAVHPILRRDVVVKVPRATLPADAQAKLIDEGRVVAQIDDPGLVRVHDVDIDPEYGRPFIVFEYVPGQTLAQSLRREEFPVERAVDLVAELADTLDRLHRRGVVHRDIKPGNILLDAAGRPRILDFGLATLNDANRAMEVPDDIVGTLQYMSPEQARGENHRVGPAADQFGLAAMLYHLLTGQPPYTGADQRSIWTQAQAAEVTALGRLNAAIPKPIARVCLRAMSADPAARFPSCAEFARQLRAAAKPAKLRPILIGVGAAACILCGAVAVYVLNPPVPEARPSPLIPPPAIAPPQPWPKLPASASEAGSFRDGEPNASLPAPAHRRSADPLPVSVPEGWTRYQSPSGSFAVALPGEGKLSAAPVAGKPDLTMHQVSSRLVEPAVHVAVSDTHFAGKVFLDKEAAYQGGLEGMLKKFQGTVLTETAIQKDGIAAKEVLVESAERKGLHARVQMVLYGSHIFLQMALGTRESVHSPAVEPFFTTFTLNRTVLDAEARQAAPAKK